MLFNSLTFLLFFALFFTIYWMIRPWLNAQNFFVLISSYVFYAWWDWRFLGLIIFSTVVDYTLGILIYKEHRKRIRKLYLRVSLFANLGLLVYFKYYNFFIHEFLNLLNSIGISGNINTLNIILPVGISFYTFQTLSYTIDIYRNAFEPTRSFVRFAAFVSFFPQLVAGPIERASRLLPQFSVKRKFDFDNARIGVSQIVWGYFKKIVIADNAAVYVDKIFDSYTQMGSLDLVVGAILFAFQIYCDFSAYSDIAIGVSRLLGFDLMTNFKYPYFSRDIAEFWRRWHISLSTWFRDYVYIPLGGSRVKLSRNILNIFIIFVVSGVWHGANWTFAIWGALNALYFLPLLIFKRNRDNLDAFGSGSLFTTVKEIPMVLITFVLTCFAWVFFRSASVTDSLAYIQGVLRFDHILNVSPTIPQYLWILIGVLLVIEFINRKRSYVYFSNYFYQSVFLVGTGLTILLYGYFVQEKSFIYFQF